MPDAVNGEQPRRVRRARSVATRETVMADAESLSEADRKQIAQDLGGFQGVKDQQQLGRLYLALIGLLAIIAILSGLAAFVLYGAGKDSAVGFMTVLTTIVGGLVGIFAPSPVASGEGRG